METLSPCEPGPSSTPTTEKSGGKRLCQRSPSHQSKWDPESTLVTSMHTDVGSSPSAPNGPGGQR